MPDIKDFQTSQSMMESAQILMASAVILRMAFGQVASVNALTSTKTLSESDSKKAVRAYKDFMGIIEKSHQAYVECSERLKKSDKVS